MAHGSDNGVLAQMTGATLPRHVAIIMDGNGRWAQHRGLARAKGHAQGVEAVRTTIQSCRRLGIPYLTLYAFSLENWRRPELEILALMGLLRRVLKSEVAKLIKNDIRLNLIGRLDRLPPDIRAGLEEAVAQTAACRALTVTIALSYSGRDEIVRAATRLAAEARDGTLDVAAIDEAAFAARLDTADLPDPDLLIRTSGEMRLSNYLLWQLAYAEIHVTEGLWPDFDEGELVKALRSYAGRQRRFGKTGEQIETTE